MQSEISNKIKFKSNILSVFDFDGTLTYYDSFISFLYFTFNKYYLAKRLILNMTIPTLWFMLHKLTRDNLKKILIKTFLTNVSELWIRQQAERFCKNYWANLMRKNGILAVAEEVNSGAEVTICSASPTLILQPFADKLGVKLIGTQLEIKNSKLTGNIIGFNCRCTQKVLRLKKVYGNLNAYYIRAWGDSIGDYELLKIAQDPYWKHFHRKK